MGIMVYSLLWVMQDFVHQPYHQHAYPHCPSSSSSGSVAVTRTVAVAVGEGLLVVPVLTLPVAVVVAVISWSRRRHGSDVRQISRGSKLMLMH